MTFIPHKEHVDSLQGLLRESLYFFICIWCSWLPGNAATSLHVLLRGWLYFIYFNFKYFSAPNSTVGPTFFFSYYSWVWPNISFHHRAKCELSTLPFFTSSQQPLWADFMRVDKLCGLIIELHDPMCGVPIPIRISVWNHRYVNVPVKWWSGVKCCRGDGELFRPFTGKQITNHPVASLGRWINFQMLFPEYSPKSQ
jgi:hypothetical protein